MDNITTLLALRHGIVIYYVQKRTTGMPDTANGKAVIRNWKMADN
jgi:hypothetical protein